jgi:hypothetical protein
MRKGRGRGAGLLTLPPFENGNGAAMSSSPREMAREGDEDVSTPFRAGALSGCAWNGVRSGDQESLWRRSRKSAAKESASG